MFSLYKKITSHHTNTFIHLDGDEKILNVDYILLAVISYTLKASSPGLITLLRYLPHLVHGGLHYAYKDPGGELMKGSD